MIPQADIERAKDMPLASFVAIVSQVMPLKREGGQWSGRCPFHNEKTPSFYVLGPKAHYHCFGCGEHGDPIAFLMHTRGLDFADAVRELCGESFAPGPPGARASGRVAKREQVDQGLSQTPSRGDPLNPWPRTAPIERPGKVTAEGHTPRPPASPILRAVQLLWREATHPSIASFYLQSRGLPSEPLPKALRGHPAVWCKEKGEKRPCVLAGVASGAGRLTAVHRIWTELRYVVGEADDARPRDLATRKKTLGELGDGAVRLAPATDRLGLAEGVESALAASKLYRRPVWAVLGVARYGHPAMTKERPDGSRYRLDERAPSIAIPGTITDLVIFGDRDSGIGEGSALWAAEWWKRQGITARALFPPEGKKDFADCL